MGRYRALSVRNRTFQSNIGAYQTKRRSSKTDKGPFQAEKLRHLRPINVLSGLLRALTGAGVPICVNGSLGQLIGSIDELFKPTGDRRRSKEGTVTVRSRAVQTGGLSGLQKALLDRNIKAFKPIDGFPYLLRALTGYRGNFSGRWNALLGSRRDKSRYD